MGSYVAAANSAGGGGGGGGGQEQFVILRSSWCYCCGCETRGAGFQRLENLKFLEISKFNQFKKGDSKLTSSSVVQLHSPPTQTKKRSGPRATNHKKTSATARAPKCNHVSTTYPSLPVRHHDLLHPRHQNNWHVRLPRRPSVPLVHRRLEHRPRNACSSWLTGRLQLRRDKECDLQI